MEDKHEWLQGVMMVAGAVVLVVGLIGLGLTMGVFASLECAWVATKLWGWFILPLFGLPVPMVWQMWGVMLFAQMFRPVFTKKGLETDGGWKQALDTMARMYLSPLFVLLVGYCVHTYCGK